MARSPIRILNIVGMIRRKRRLKLSKQILTSFLLFYLITIYINLIIELVELDHYVDHNFQRFVLETLVTLIYYKNVIYTRRKEKIGHHFKKSWYEIAYLMLYLLPFIISYKMRISPQFFTFTFFAIRRGRMNCPS
uniref:Ion_trans domain-containing protein n=1 Tax=Heterorhabditis bacteriophora TaxID=37862 RepID=A0A1I7W8C1_HETBA